MIADPNILELFFPFEREVGLYRAPIHSYEEFTKYIDQNNGIHDCVVSLYPRSGAINKIVFDIDSKRHPGKALETACRLYLHFSEQGYRVFPVFSGRKGYHLHFMAVSVIPESVPKGKALLKASSTMLLSKAFAEDPHQLLKGGIAKYVDTSVVGDLRQIIRVPNTLRPYKPSSSNPGEPWSTQSWCVFLPETFFNMSQSEILDYAKEPHLQRYSNTRLLDLHDLASPILDDLIIEESSLPQSRPLPHLEGEGLLSHRILKTLMRPCLWNRINEYNPSDTVRLATTADLLSLGFDTSQILSFYSSLNWIDFDSTITAQRIEKCKNLHSYACKTLRYHGIPRCCCIG